MNRQEVIDNGELIHTDAHSKVRYFKYKGSVWSVYKRVGFSDIAYCCGCDKTWHPT